MQQKDLHTYILAAVFSSNNSRLSPEFKMQWIAVSLMILGLLQKLHDSPDFNYDSSLHKPVWSNLNSKKFLSFLAFVTVNLL
ncbi:hypothetical protein [Vibrio sagamiensis]|uniref:Uncharacterized protein n=1 Tax=Vibrio sagamiensis NBRC 104589 TaxID=1219064 RepID=A0A511QC69_9VIBR|nr:hypothetical protein [Vibrio sagamiensis]GEM74893.1 hypothetical protein VSA01S_10050 [Vibrio sagamiensis NBRC 104589]